MIRHNVKLCVYVFLHVRTHLKIWFIFGKQKGVPYISSRTDSILGIANENDLQEQVWDTKRNSIIKMPRITLFERNVIGFDFNNGKDNYGNIQIGSFYVFNLVDLYQCAHLSGLFPNTNKKMVSEAYYGKYEDVSGLLRCCPYVNLKLHLNTNIFRAQQLNLVGQLSRYVC